MRSMDVGEDISLVKEEEGGGLVSCTSGLLRLRACTEAESSRAPLSSSREGLGVASAVRATGAGKPRGVEGSGVEAVSPTAPSRDPN